MIDFILSGLTGYLDFISLAGLVFTAMVALFGLLSIPAAIRDYFDMRGE